MSKKERGKEGVCVHVPESERERGKEKLGVKETDFFFWFLVLFCLFFLVKTQSASRSDRCAKGREDFSLVFLELLE